MKRVLLSAVVILITATVSSAADQRRPCGPGSGHSPIRLLFLQSVFGADFRPACRVHDDCYGAKSGKKKTECDARFLADLMCACENSATPGLCRLVAKSMYGAVKMPVSEHFFEGDKSK